MTDSKLIFTKVCNSEKNMSELYGLLFKSVSPNYRAYLLIGHGTPYFHRRLRKTLGTNVYIISIEDESFEYSWKCMKKNEDVFFIDLNNIKQLVAILTIIGTKIGMKFDCIIMNPPYAGSLHLNILNVCLNHISDKGEITNLSPIRWLQDPLAESKNKTDFKKFENIRNRIENITSIRMEDGYKYFGVPFMMDLGIYHITSKGGFDSTSLMLHKDLIKKVESKISRTLLDVCEEDAIDGWRCRIQKIAPFPSNLPNGVAAQARLTILCHPYFDWVYKDGYTRDNIHWSNNIHHKAGPKSFTENDNLPYSIKFNSKEEAYNFQDYTKTNFFKFLYKTMKTDQNVPLRFLPFMPTYAHPWTDEMLYEYFNLTDDEIKEIEEAIK